MSRAPGRLVSVLAALALTGCSSGPTEEALRGALAAMQANCLVVVLDAAGAGHFSTYGYARETTPNIDRLASGAVVFDRAYAPGVSTIVSVPSLFAGLYPQALARGAVDDPTRLVRAMPWLLKRQADRGASPLRLARAFRDAGFRTGGFSGNIVVSAAFGLSEGFDDFETIDGERDDTSPELVDHLLTWMSSVPGARTFAYLHFIQPHTPYLPPPDIAAAFRPRGYAGTLRPDTLTLVNVDVGKQAVTPEDVEFLKSQYDANVFYGDALVERVVQGLRDRKLDDRTVIIVTADHGEAFGEHGRFLHNTTLYQEMLRIPLVVHFPRSLGVRPVRIAEPVSLVDVLPTLRALFELRPGDERVDGRSFVPLMLGAERGSASRLLFAQTGTQVAVVQGERKYIHGGYTEGKTPAKEELYDLHGDPGETHDLSAADPETVAVMRTVVDKFTGKETADVGFDAAAKALDPAVVRRLRAMGYLGGPDEP